MEDYPVKPPCWPWRIEVLTGRVGDSVSLLADSARPLMSRLAHYLQAVRTEQEV